VEHPFDELTKTLAQRQSRRETLRQVGGLLGGLLLTTLGLPETAWAASRNCTRFCASFPKGKKRQNCLARCKKCHQSRPKRVVCQAVGNPNKAICCKAGADCCDGACCEKPLACCSFGGPPICVDLQRHPYACGACGRQCANDEICDEGVCRNPCPGRGRHACRRAGSDEINCCEPTEICRASGRCEEVCEAPTYPCVDDLGGFTECCSPGLVCKSGRCELDCPDNYTFCPALNGVGGDCCPPRFTCRNGLCVSPCDEDMTPCVSRKRPGEIVCVPIDRPECICCPDADRIQDLVACGDPEGSIQFVCCGGTACGTPYAVCINGECELA
jgi:hypothetical protein